MKILLVTVYSISFVEKDLKILQSKYEVTYCNLYNDSTLYLIKEILKNDLVFFWFASIRFFLPLIVTKILKKKIIILTGGYDVVSLKDLNYGSMSSRWKSIVVKFMLKLSDKVLSVSLSNTNELITNCNINPSKIEMIYHGFEEVGQVNFSKKTDIIITVAFINKSSFYRKGIDRFLKLAENLPYIKFHLIGKMDFYPINDSTPENLVIHGFLEKGKLESILESAKIYIQFSRHEGFGCSVAEAMQFGCIPVVSNSFSLPEVVGDCGLIITDFSNYHEIAAQIRKLLENYKLDMSIKCIERINNKFNYRQRKTKLINIIENLKN